MTTILKPPPKPRTLLRFRAGDHDEQANSIEALPFGIVERRDSDEGWSEEPVFAALDSGATFNGKPLGAGRHQRILVEIATNVAFHTLQAHREARDGKRPFCACAHCGTSPGVATRRNKDQGYYLTECEPDKCDLYQNNENPGSRLHILSAEGEGGWRGTYQYAQLSGVKKKQNRQTKQWEEAPTTISCKPLVYFLFHLVDPRDPTKLLHPPTEYCHFQTRSLVNLDLFTQTLEKVYRATGGRMAGFRLWLFYQPFPNAFGQTVSAWNLETPDGDFGTQLKDAADRRGKYDSILSGDESSVLVPLTESRLATIPDGGRPQMDPLDEAVASFIFRRMITREEAGLVTDHPVVQALARRLKVSYAVFTSWPGRYDDPFHLIASLVKICAAKGYPVTDILRGTDFEGLIVLPPAQAATVASADIPEQGTPVNPYLPPETSLEVADEAEAPEDGVSASDVRGGSGEVIEAEFEEVSDVDNSAGDIGGIAHAPAGVDSGPTGVAPVIDETHPDWLGPRGKELSNG